MLSYRYSLTSRDVTLFVLFLIIKNEERFLSFTEKSINDGV
jgi:hypothetical protein